MRPGLGAQGCGGQGDFSRTLCSCSTAAMRWRRSSCAPVLLKSGGLHSKGGGTELFSAQISGILGAGVLYPLHGWIRLCLSPSAAARVPQVPPSPGSPRVPISVS